MVSEAVLQTFEELIPKENIYIDEPMSVHTTFKVGGSAACMVEPQTQEQLSKICKYLRLVELPFAVLGNGSNTLVRDCGYDGVVLHLGQKFSQIQVVSEVYIIAQAGALLSQVAKTACENGLSGMEFASGIPGTVGGAVVMNAGAYGGEMSGIVEEVKVVSPEGEILTLSKDSMEFGYRKSIIKNRPFIVSEVTFKLKPADSREISALMDKLAIKRRETQPLE